MRSLLLLFIGLAAASWADAQTIVRQDGTGNFTTISAALGAAVPGSTIVVDDNATYVEDLLIMVPGLTLRAGDARRPILRPASTTMGSTHLFAPFALGTRIDGLRFEAAGSAGDGVHFSGMSIDCQITDCEFEGYGGVGAHALLVDEGILFIGDALRVFGCRRGITVLDGEPAFISNCLVTNNPQGLASVDWGMQNAGVDPAWIGFINCTVDTDSTGPGLILNVNNLNGMIGAAPPSSGGGQPIPGVPLPCTEFGRVFVGNCILANGMPSLVLNGDPCHAQNNCVDTAIAGLPANNRSGPIGFRDRPNGDFDLTFFSGCRNTGADAWLDMVVRDIEGTVRPMSAAVDIGAYESTGANSELDARFDAPTLSLFLSGPAGTIGGGLAIGALSQGSAPGLLIPTGRFPLQLDPLLFTSKHPAFASFFGGLDGIVDGSGQHVGTVNIPGATQAAISGTTVFAAFLIVDASQNTMILGHSTAVEFTIP